MTKLTLADIYRFQEAKQRALYVELELSGEITSDELNEVLDLEERTGRDTAVELLMDTVNPSVLKQVSFNLI